MSMLRTYHEQVNNLFFTIFRFFFTKRRMFKKYTTFLYIAFVHYFMRTRYKEILIKHYEKMKKSQKTAKNVILSMFFAYFHRYTRIIKDIKQKGKLKLTFQRSYLHYYVVYPSMRPNPIITT